MGFLSRPASSTSRKWRLVCLLFVILALPHIAAARIQQKPAGGQPSQQITRLSPQQLYKRLAPSVFVVEVFDAQGKVTASGSGVVVASDIVATNHHVIEDAAIVRVRQGARTWTATIQQRDPDTDLALLAVKGLKAPAVSLRASSTVAVGERVYAIGAPEGLEMTFSDGLVSGFRSYKQSRVIQTTAAISHGSSGGGLFDTQGRLVGITTFSLEDGQQLNFALPSDTLSQLYKRSQETNTQYRATDAAARQEYAQALADYDKALAEIATRTLILEGHNAIVEGLKADTQQNDRSKAIAAYEKALAAFKEAARKDSDNMEAWQSICEAYNYLGQFDLEIKTYREAARKWPEEGWPHYGIGKGLMGNGNSYGALIEYREALRLKRWDDYLQFLLLGIDLEKMGALDEAITAFQENLRQAGSRQGFPVHFFLGKAFFRRGNFRDAIVEFRKELALTQRAKKGYILIGDALYHSGNDNEALAAYRESLKHFPDPSKPDHHYILGAIFHINGDTKGAIAEFSKVVSLDPDHTEAHYRLGKALEDSGNFSEALDEYRKAYSLDPNSPFIADAYEGLKRRRIRR